MCISNINNIKLTSLLENAPENCAGSSRMCATTPVATDFDFHAIDWTAIFEGGDTKRAEVETKPARVDSKV